jgi:hypothetical protein
MTAPRCQRPNWDIDVTTAITIRQVLYAAIVCVHASAASYAAEIGTSGAEAGSPRGATLTPQAATRRSQTDSAAGANRNTVPSWSHPETLRGASVLPQRGAGRLPGLNAGARTQALPPARGYPLRRPQADYRAERRDPAAAAARSAGSVPLSSAAGRLFPSAASAAVRPAASLRAQPGNGVIGGPHGPGAGALGGTVSSKSVSKASIDGSALHRRL